MLQRRRYRGAFHETLAAARTHESWTPERLADFQLEALRRILTVATGCVPYYRELAGAQDLRPEDLRSLDDLRRWPILEKDVVRVDPGRLISDRLRPANLIVIETSGTTGTPLLTYRDLQAERRWFAYFERRIRHWAGVTHRDRWAMLGGRIVVPVLRARPPFWKYNPFMHQLYMSSYHLAPAFLDHYLEALRRYRPVYLYGYASSCEALARHALARGATDVRFRAALTSSETLFQHQRAVIEQAFGCRVYDSYGSAEMVALVTECDRSRLHISPEVGVVEVLKDDRPAHPGEMGELVCTGLLNEAMPLIRYRTGDAAVQGSGPCPCGRPLPVLERIEGRVDDLLWTRDGRAIGRLDPVFKGVDHVAESQIIQETLEQLRVRLVPATGYREEDGRRVVSNLRERMGDVRVVLEIVPSIERAGGKFRAVICRLPKALRGQGAKDGEPSKNTVGTMVSTGPRGPRPSGD
jgi:phenylacetate-coenzyme A ligase PaaK-like adenylate-forming protein